MFPFSFLYQTRTFSVLAFLALFTLQVQAQAVEEVIVTASPVAESTGSLMRSVTVINRSAIEASPATTLADLLANEGGITLSRRGAPGVQADIGIRGSNFEQTLMLVDGIPIQSPQTGHNNSNVPVPLQAIERIEIVEGPGALQYGASTTGGVINIITRKPAKQGVSGSVNMAYGSHQTRELGASVAYRGDNVAQQLTVNGLRADSEDEDKPTDAELLNVLYTGSTLEGPVTVHWGAGQTKKEFGAWGFYSDVFPNAREKINSHMAWLGLNYSGDVWQVASDIYWRDYKDWFNTTIGVTDYINRHKTQVYGLKTDIQRHDATGATAMGVHVRQEIIDSNALMDHSRKEASVWLMRKQQLSESWRLDMGVNVAHYSEFKTYWLPSLALAWQFSEDWHSYVSAARSARQPSYTESNMKTSGNWGKPNITPEKMDAIEWGFIGTPADHYIKAALFERHSNSLIDWSNNPTWACGANAPTPSLVYCADSFADYRAYGLDAGWKWQPELPGLQSIKVDWLWMNVDLDSHRQKVTYARHVPNYTLSIGWQTKLSERTLLSVNARRPNYKQQDAATLLDFRLGWQVQRLTLALEGSNLLNERINEAAFSPIAGRWYKLSATVHF